MNFFKRRPTRVITQDTIGTPDPNAPKWLTIIDSDVWNKELLPFFEILRDKAFLELMNAKTPEDVYRLQGEAKTYMKILSYPENAAKIELARKLKFEQEEEEKLADERRRDSSNGWLARHSRHIRSNPNRPRNTVDTE